jgi:uncharacterized protein (DUF488 family)
MISTSKEIWTIGHSTRPIDEFIKLLQGFGIEIIVDIRTFPGSRRYPHFNKEDLEKTLAQHAIGYKHMLNLGGRRKPRPDSPNGAWRHASFRGYADHMQTPEFEETIHQLEDIALQKRIAYMCSEAMWWKCHRSLVSDYLKVRGWIVWHILHEGKTTEHPYTSPAKPVQGKLFY